RTGQTEPQRPPGVRRETPVGTRDLGDLAVRVVVGPRRQAAGGLPQVEGHHRAEPAAQQQPDRTDVLLPVGDDAVGEPDDSEEDQDGHENADFGLHRFTSSWVAVPATTGSLLVRERMACGAYSGWCRSKAGRSERIGGMAWKLCRGGGLEVAHSRLPP